MSTQNNIDIILQVSAHALAETTMAQENAAELLSQTPLFSNGEGSNAKSAAEELLTQEPEQMEIALVHAARGRAGQAITAYDSDDDLVFSEAERLAFASGELGAFCDAADAAALMAGCAKLTATNSSNGEGLVNTDAIALALLVLSTTFLTEKEHHAAASRVAKQDLIDELDTVKDEVESLTHVDDGSQEFGYGESEAAADETTPTPYKTPQRKGAVPRSTGKGEFDEDDDLDDISMTTDDDYLSATDITPSPYRFSRPGGGDQNPSEAPATPLGAGPKSEESEDLQLKITIMRDMIAAHEKTIAQLRAENEEAARAKEAASAEHAKTKQELADALAVKDDLCQQIENMRSKLGDSLNASAKQRQEHDDMVKQLKQKLSSKFNMSLDDLLQGNDEEVQPVVTQKQSQPSSEEANTGLSDKEREKYERVIAELNAENQKLSNQLKQQEEDSKKTISDLRAAISDLQFKLDHAASESHTTQEPVVQQASADTAAPLFTRPKPEVQVVTEKVVVKDPQDELRIKMLEEQRAQEKAVYLKHIEEVEEKLRQAREDTKQNLLSQREQYEQQIADLRSDYEKQLESLRTAVANANAAAAAAAESEAAAKKRAEDEPKIDTEKLRADERTQTLLAVVRAMNDVLSREAYASVLSVKPADDSNPESLNERTCAGKMQEVAEIAKSLYDRASSAPSESSRKSSTYEISLLREENEKLKKDAQELQRRYDALARQKSKERQLELEVQRLELANKQLQMNLDNNKNGKKDPVRGTIQVASASDSSDEDSDISDGEEHLKRNLLKQSIESERDNLATCNMKRWIVILITVIVGIVCLGVGGGVGFFISKQMEKSS